MLLGAGSTARVDGMLLGIWPNDEVKKEAGWVGVLTRVDVTCMNVELSWGSPTAVIPGVQGRSWSWSESSDLVNIIGSRGCASWELLR